MVRWKWDMSGFKDLRKSPEVAAAISTEVEEVLQKTGDDHYAGGVEDGGNRVRGYVVTADGPGIRDNAKNHTILKAVGGDHVLYTSKAGRTSLLSKKQAAYYGRGRK